MRRYRMWLRRCSPTATLAGSAPGLEERPALHHADDTRWARCDIKSVSLLANVLLRQLAVDADASETILLRDGQLIEASASSVHVVIGGVLCTPPNSWKLLPGTTRGVIEEVAENAGVNGDRRRCPKPNCVKPPKSC